MAKPGLKLSGVKTLIVDADRYSVGILKEMMRGLRMASPSVVETAEEAKVLLETRAFDLCVCEARLSDGTGASFVRWIRNLKSPVRFLNVIVLTEYSQLRNVTGARDAGANLVMRKPVSPRALYDRIAWAAATARPFVECEVYVGPDRRFKYVGPPDGVGRRDGDISAETGAVIGPNMSQDEIAMMMKQTHVITP